MKSGRGNRGMSLQSVAQSLSSSHYKHQKPNRNVTIKDENPADKLRSGRHICDCQARVHSLLRNCMGCGRIVCEQEGSGPCFSCGELVCTREEREILDRNSKKSVELYNKLMLGRGKDGEGQGISLSSLGSALTKAEEFKNKLLEADADTEHRTHVHDLETDYYNMENNAYLTKEERDAIVARKEELKQMRKQQRRALVVDLDLENRTFAETKEKQDHAMDPVILSILEMSRQRQSDAPSNTNKDALIPSFIPRYDERMGRPSKNVMSVDEVLACDDIICVLNEEMMYAEVERRGYSIPVQQPLASLLAIGIRRHLEWSEEVDLRGPVFLASTARPATQAEIDDEVNKCRDRAFNNFYGEETGGGLDREYPLSYPCGAIVGRALLVDCLPIAEYVDQYPQGECAQSREGFVLMFKAFSPLLVPIPHIPPTSNDLYTVDKQLRTAIKHILDPYSFH